MNNINDVHSSSLGRLWFPPQRGLEGEGGGSAEALALKELINDS